MQSNPFTIFAPFAEKFSVWMIARSDSPEDALTIESINQLIGKDTAVPIQVHGGDCTYVDTCNRTEADAYATDQVGMPLGILWADCQNFVFYSPEKHVCAVAHAGWPGLLKNVLGGTVERLTQQWDVDPSTLYVGAGPSLCLQCSEFSNPQEELQGIDPKFFHERLVDLQGIAEQQLEQLGVDMQKFERLPQCTKCDNSQFWSYRGTDREAVKNARRNAMVCMLG